MGYKGKPRTVKEFVNAIADCSGDGGGIGESCKYCCGGDGYRGGCNDSGSGSTCGGVMGDVVMVAHVRGAMLEVVM
ncbi:hypothetical protein ElyMa_005026300 [Elysia marginata]|uniref:Uncharacterized protein n=1 Tax=Elysia marginata TaxID=1093978 RepID=A0AAV4JB19_9GAST|nr:hypothetical protein ElyMa_005026300 [Elysia marginata]